LCAVIIAICQLPIIDICRAGSVTLDGSLGHTAGPILSNNGIFQLTPTSGKQVGSNLFFSLGQFNLDKGETAEFSGPNSVANVLTRVTGGPSSIDGTIQCTIPSANFFLINSAGVVFGHDSALNVQGSFAVTSADVIHLSDGGKFRASLAGNSVLTTAPPSAFGFLSYSPGSIAVQGTSPTQNPDGNLTEQFHPSLNPASTGALTVVGGNVTIRGGELATAGTAPALIVSVASPGTVNLNNPTDTQSFSSMGTLEVKAGGIVGSDASSTGGTDSGPVTVTAGRVELSGNGSIASTASFANLGGESGAVSVNTTGAIEMNGSSIISAGGADTGALSLNAGGNINLNGGSITSASVSGISSAISIASQQSIHIEGAEVESSSPFDLAGPVTISAGRDVDVGTSSASSASLIMSFGDRGSQTVGVVAGGDVNVGSKGAIRSFAPFPISNAEAVTITAAGNIQVSGGGMIESDGSGTSGNVAVNASQSVIISGGGIVESLAGVSCGPVLVKGSSVDLDGSGSLLPTGILISGPFPSGAGANIVVNAQSLSVLNGASISADSFGTTAAGIVNVSVDGNALLANGGSVTARSFLGGNGGIVRLRAGALTLDASTVSADNYRNAIEGGLVHVEADTVTLEDGASITATAGAGLSQLLTATLNFDINSLVDTANVFLVSPTGTRIELDTSPQDRTYGDLGSSQGVAPIDGRFASYLAKDLDGTWNLQIQVPPSAGTSANPPVTLDSWSLSLGGKTIGVSSSPGSGTDFNVPLLVSGISAGLTGGLGGDVIVNARQSVVVQSGSSISTATFGTGPAGNLSVRSPQLAITGIGSIIDSDAGRAPNAPQATGDAGSVEVDIEGSATLSAGGQLAVSAPLSNAGAISLNAGSVNIIGGGIAANANSAGGDILINTPPDAVVTILNSVITAHAGTVGGQISIDPALVIIGDGSTINGLAGDHNLTVDIMADALLVSSDSQILADRPAFVVNMDIAAGLVALPQALPRLGLSLVPTCECNANGDLSTFIVTGNGLPPSPGGWLLNADNNNGRR
jgi:filamentous hemagglutinin family protein